jgi:hypothetical protein
MKGNEGEKKHGEIIDISNKEQRVGGPSIRNVNKRRAVKRRVRWVSGR